MKRIYIFILSIISFLAVSAQETYFLYPTPPANIENFYERCNFMTEHFWDNCNIKSAFSSRERLKGAFKDYVSIAMYAGVDTTMSSINALIKSVEKMPKNLLTLAKIAEGCLYSDTAEVYSEQMYLPFAQAVADCKKVPSADRNYFAKQAKILSSSQVGMPLAEFKFQTPDGKKEMFSGIDGKRVIIYINDPGQDDCRRTLVRLSADYNLKQLHEKGFMQFVSIYPKKADDKWREAVKEYPESWIVGASEEIGSLFNVEKLPVAVYISSENKILTKSIDSDKLIDMFRMLNVNTK